MIDYSKEISFAEALAKKAGKIMLKHFQIGVAREVKDNNTPVTIADTAINSLVVKEIKTNFPTHAVLGEEESHRFEDEEMIWVCDPIDGTIPYSAGVPTNVFSLSLVETNGGQPVVAVIYDPYLDRLYSAIKGQGAKLNNQPIRVNEVSELSSALIGQSGGQSSVVHPNRLKSEIIDKAWRQICLSCVLYEAMMVATGEMAANVFPGAGAHDAAGAKLIVEEAGGRVTNLFGEEQRYDQPIKGAVISNGKIHDQLVQIAKKHAK